MTTTRPKWPLALLFSAWVLALSPYAGVAGGSATVKVGAGYDSNVFEAGDVPGADRVDGFFSNLELSLTPPKFGQGKQFTFRPEGFLRWYPDASSGNRLGGSVLLRFSESWKKHKENGFRRVLKLSLDGYVDYERALFLRRTIREDIGIGVIVPDLSFGELPARSEIGLEAKLGARTSKRVTVTTELTARMRDYTNSSNAAVAEYSRLDDRQVGLGLSVNLNLPKHWEVTFGGMFRNRVNPQREARDADGASVQGVDRHFWYWDGTMLVYFEEGRVNNEAELSLRNRSDRYQGYYSYNQIEFSDRFKVEVSGSTDAELEVLLGQRQYDIYAPVGVPLENNYVTVALDLRTRVTKRVRFSLKPVYDSNSSNDPVLDYDRYILFAELRVAL